MVPTLVVLAAGMGTRYGGLKQVDPIGPSGETVLDYGVFDATRAGFTRVVFVIRREFEAEFQARVTAKYAGRIRVDFVHQALDDLPAGGTAPAGRERPWGTGHAVWCARHAVTGPFAVMNADDFYGATAFSRLAAFLGQAAGPHYAMVGFRLAHTLSAHGTVSRGICREELGRLVSLREEKAIAAADVGPGGRFSGTELVSMNFWGFTPALFAGLESGLRAFLAARPGPTDEFYLPAAVSAQVAAGAATVTVLPSEEAWFGITYQEDKRPVMAAVAALVGRGVYPHALYG